jgi:hypothetical protein
MRSGFLADGRREHCTIPGIARSLCDEAIQSSLAAFWIAALLSFSQ